MFPGVTRRLAVSIPRRSPLALAALAALLALLLAGVVLAGLVEALAYLLPPLLLLTALVTRSYPGETTLLALMRPAPARPRPARGGRIPRCRRAVAPRGGALIALSLAVRPPPSPAAALR
jgi:hypothetical protein